MFHNFFLVCELVLRHETTDLAACIEQWINGWWLGGGCFVVFAPCLAMSGFLADRARRARGTSDSQRLTKVSESDALKTLDSLYQSLWRFRNVSENFLLVHAIWSYCSSSNVHNASRIGAKPSLQVKQVRTMQKK